MKHILSYNAHKCSSHNVDLKTGWPLWCDSKQLGRESVTNVSDVEVIMSQHNHIHLTINEELIKNYIYISQYIHDIIESIDTINFIT